MTAPISLTWRWCRFDELRVGELQAINRARQQVFAVEQGCAYLDADGLDECSHHLAAWSAQADTPVAYARVIDPTRKYAEPSIGRVLTDAGVRGSGLGRDLVGRAIGLCTGAFPGLGIRISAQTRLVRFYEEAGFVAVGVPYLEDGIAHSEMWRPG